MHGEVSWPIDYMFTLSVVVNSAEHALSTKIIKHKYILMCKYKIHINIKLCRPTLNSTSLEPRFQSQCAIGQYV